MNYASGENFLLQSNSSHWSLGLRLVKIGLTNYYLYAFNVGVSVNLKASSIRRSENINFFFLEFLFSDLRLIYINFTIWRKFNARVYYIFT